MPSIEAWEAFAGVGAVIIFLGAVVFGFQRLGVIGQKKRAPAPAETPKASPEVLALIEATQTLVKATEAIATRSEVLGRIHKRLDDVDRELSDVKAQNARLEGKLDQHTATLHLIEQHLLSQK